jgi:hypothetical protein
MPNPSEIEQQQLEDMATQFVCHIMLSGWPVPIRHIEYSPGWAANVIFTVSKN